MFLRVSIAASAALVLCGCITAEQQASVTEPPRSIKCHAGPDCNAKWSRATVWVTEHSKYKLETSSESLIETSGPGAFETDSSPAYKITKVAMGPDEYTIEFAGGCDSIFGCTPTIPAARADFTQSILAAEAAPQSRPTKKDKKAAYQTSSR
jgi:hypothetical protein